jgi:CRP-like cAMP-binding protein
MRQLLFRQATLQGIFPARRGAVRLERSTFDGRQVRLHTARAGEFLAEASLFSDTYHCNAVAIEHCVVRCYPKATVLALVEGDPTSATSLLASMAHQVQILRQRLELRSVRSAQDRLLLALELRAEADGTVHLTGDIQSLALDLGLSREVVYRTLAALAKRGTIVRSRSLIRLLKRTGV